MVQEFVDRDLEGARFTRSTSAGAVMRGVEVREAGRGSGGTAADVLDLRAERQAMVREFLATVTPELLAEPRRNPWSAET
jgi:hypothetical protein